MFRERRHFTREKRLLPPRPEDCRSRFYLLPTLTDDHTLFLLNQRREQRLKKKHSWLSRLLRRR